jgi:hypothetical protein
MKKLLTICLLLVLVSCISFASGNKESQNLLDDLQGTWKQVDGKSVITITGNDFTILNMEIGYAGYGIVSIGTLNGRKTLVFNFYNRSTGRSTKGNLVYLGFDDKFINSIDSGSHHIHKDTLFINDFQMKAREEFGTISEKNEEGFTKYPDHILEKYFNNLHLKDGCVTIPYLVDGGAGFYFELNEDNLKLIDASGEANEKYFRNEIPHLYNLLFGGELKRIK